MILYFSATGNSKYVAERIAVAAGDQAVSIEKSRRTLTLSSDEMLGFVTPTYSFELPIIVRKYLKKLVVKGEKPSYVFIAATYGMTPGAAGAEAERILKARGIEVSAEFGIQMPETFTPFFSVRNTRKVKRQNAKAEIMLNQVIEKILNRETGNFLKKSMPYGIRRVSDKAYQSLRRTSHFTVEDTCIGCALCAEKCPSKAIEIKDQKPVWVKERCVMCLRCLHYCPKFAVQYGSRTKKHGQYRNPNVKI